MNSIALILLWYPSLGTWINYSYITVRKQHKNDALHVNQQECKHAFKKWNNKNDLFLEDVDILPLYLCQMGISFKNNNI